MAVLHFSRPIINVSNMERSLAFYRDLLGMKIVSDSRMADPARVAQRKSAGLAMGLSDPDLRWLVLEIPGEQGRGLQLVQWFNPEPRPRARTPRLTDKDASWIAFDVQGLRELYEHLKNHGVKFFGSLAEREGGRGICFGIDPDGNVVELHGTL